MIGDAHAVGEPNDSRSARFCDVAITRGLAALGGGTPLATRRDSLVILFLIRPPYARNYCVTKAANQRC